MPLLRRRGRHDGPMSYVGGSAPPGHVVAPARRRGWVKIVVAVLGTILVAVPLLVGGFVVTIAVSRVGSISPDAQGRVPGDLSFDADDGRTYAVALGTGIVNETGGGRAFHTAVAHDIRCTITHPDGDTDEIRGDRQASSVETGNYASVGEFEGRGGETMVDCTSTSNDVFGDERDLPMIVHGINTTLRYVGYGLIAGGVVVLLGCLGLLFWGIRGRAA